MFILENDDEVYTGRLTKMIWDMCKQAKFWTMTHCGNVNDILSNMNKHKAATAKFLHKHTKRTQYMSEFKDCSTDLPNIHYEFLAGIQ